MKLFSLALLSLVSSTVSGLTPAQWRGQSVYQVLTDRFARSDGSTTATCNTGDQDYCGGTWRGIINRLDYIQGMGFTAVWISPVTKQLVGDSSDGESYHGYWQQNIYELNSNFGTADDLRDLSAALHARGMYLMVDIVTNHFAYLGCGDCVDYSQFVPFNSESYFHDFCLINYNDVNTIKNCWMGDNTVSLPDMRTEDSYVASVWNDWISDLVANYSIDGLRLDSAQQVNNDFFPPFETAAGVYIVGEVFNGDPAYVCPYQNSLSGILNFPTYFWVTQAFQSTSGSISNLVNGINNLKSTCKDTTLMGSFLENHDVQRFPYLTSDLSLTKNAIAFTILQDGIPIVYYGQEQRYNGGDVPYDREALWFSGYSTSATLYTFIGSVNQIRNQAIYKDPTYLTYKAYPVYSDSSTIVMRKGFTGAQIIAVFSNLGASGSSYTLSLTSSQTGFTANQALVEVLTCTAYTTDSSGTLAVAMSGGLPRVFYPTAQLVGSGICGALTGTSSTTLVKNSVISTASSTNNSTPSSSATTSTTASTATTTCTPSASIAITFNAQIPTVYGETIKLVGSIGALGSWAPENAIALDAYSYTASEPLWQTTISLAPGTSFEYKFINVAANGRVSWEADPNRSFTVPVGCGAAVSVVGRWQD